MRSRAPVTARVVFALVTTALVLAPSAAFAAEGNIDHVETSSGELRVLYSVPDMGVGTTPDLDTLTASIDGQELDASAALAAESDDSEEGIQRTTILAIDVSNSMNGERFEEAKEAARTYLEAAPVDVLVGIVTFAGDVEVVQPPTLDRAAAVGTLDGLELSRQTLLYDGIRTAVAELGSEGLRSLLVLSDGGDTSATALADVRSEITAADITVDVVALAQSEANTEKLRAIADAGSGQVLEADDPTALSALFEHEAEALARQVLVTSPLPEGSASEASLTISVEADGETYTDSAYVALLGAEDLEKRQLGTPPIRSDVGFLMSNTFMVGGLVAAGLGTLVVLLGALGVLSRRKETVEDRIAAYSRQSNIGPRPGGFTVTAPAPREEGAKSSARAVAEKALARNKGAEAALGTRLDAAGMSMKPAEWVLLHAGVAFVSGLVGMLLGSIVLALILLGGGLVGPYLYLGFKKGRRVKAFNEQLADTLQLMSGSLSAGLSFAQSADTVVREGSEPVTTEFKRALVETRLGVSIEDALEGVADRMQSADFKWVVLAVRIQREVGGNLSEVLSQVAATIRERAYLRRQIKSLSAEGVLSAWILGAMPPAMFVYFLMVRPEYMQPMFDQPIGWAMLAGGAVLMAIGAFWMSRLVKLEV